MLELLVVIVIVAVLAGMVVPSLSMTGGRRLGQAAERLALLVNRGRQEAALGSTVWRLRFQPEAHRYRFERRIKGGGFRGITKGPFGTVRTPSEIRWRQLRINGQPASGSATVYLFPTGEQDAFDLTLGYEGSERTVSLGPVGRARLAPEGSE